MAMHWMKRRTTNASGGGNDVNFFHTIRERERELHKPNSSVKTSYFTPSLVEICARTIAADFENQPPIEHIDSSLQQLVVSFLSTNLPIQVAVPRVESQDYWKACCEARWSLGKLGDSKITSKEEGGWKRVYLERNLEEFLEALEDEYPDGVDSKIQLPKLAELSAPWVYKLCVGRLKCHISLPDFFDWLPKLSSFKVSYGVLTTGMNFEFRLFGIRQADCLGFAEVLRHTKTLTSLSLPENQIDGDKLKAIITGLVRNYTITHLDLSHNKIDDGGIKALATLLIRKKQTIVSLNLADNNMRCEGAKSLGRNLKGNTTLTDLNIRLNRIGDDGGKFFLDGIKENTALQEVNMSSNDLGAEFVKTLAELLRTNTTLTKLDITANSYGEDGGKVLLDAIEQNTSLLWMDTRMSGVNEKDKQEINDALKKRANAKARAKPISAPPSAKETPKGE
eukprot:TRINITY_DN95620_c0_g1_i1.p1 TRINITY_DN95620_c0_g1~~TRINITY_DN95620_c0_g1_i1.p1  ORF type:complete len:451 (-),score=38.13 TRINITY_DN95620_c0_g1_i1:120-1472(-)